MSGTSLDGVDIAFCILKYDKKWSYKIVCAETIPYPKKWKDLLQTLEGKSALEYVLANTQYGHYLGKLIKSFIKKHKIKADLISSHGHTIFHQPQNRLTTQIGNGAAIAAECGIPVVCDFRTKDVAMGGQGAPLVPIGDKLLFHQYDHCLNLGGFANISFSNNEKRIAYDICPVNIVLNALAEKLGKKYDAKGSIARKGNLNSLLLKKLNALLYYKKNYPKSLGKEWVIQEIFPLIKKIKPADALRTFTEHAAIQISRSVANSKPDTRNPKLLLTGGGVYNDFLIDRIRAHIKKTQIIIPDKLTIEFKEALIFALLGVLRYRGEVNSLRSVTGASTDNIGGAIYL